MLVIRAEQMAVIERARWRAFVERALDYARAHWSEQADLPERVDRALSAARGHGMRSEFDLLRYVALSFVLGPRFDDDQQFPWAREVLQAPQYGARTKMDLLWQSMLLAWGGTDEPVDPPAPAEAADDAPAWQPLQALPLDAPLEPFEPASEDPGEVAPEVLVDVSTEDSLEAA